MKKGVKTFLIILGSVVGLLLVAALSAFFYIRSLMAAPTAAQGAPDDAAVAETAYGAVRGFIDSDGIYTYHGIPYAEARARFQPAEKPQPWTGILDAAEYGPISPQGAILGGSSGGNDDGVNDCQNLNLWTPGLDGEKRPVMVWLHGGGFSSGSANGASSDGASLSRFGDVVVVGVNHRLNVYGHLDLSAYGEEYRYSGNVGVMDIVLALEWIEENIEAFGGDPENITVFGQSGGGAKVLALMTSPYAKGHFQKGIAQSGATETLGVTFTSQDVSARITEHLLAALDIDPIHIEALQTVSNQELQQAATQALQETAEEFSIPQALGNGYAMEWGPVIDGDYLPTNPVTEDGFAEAGFDVPLLIGSNLNEWSIVTNLGTRVSGEVKEAFEAAYPNERPSGAGMVDSLLRPSLLKIMSHKADQGGAPVYAYVFTRQIGVLGVYHGAEIPFVFHHASGALGDAVSAAWVSFARTGVPAAEGLPAWEPYTREGGATMILDDVSYLAYHHDRALMELLVPDYEY